MTAPPVLAAAIIPSHSARADAIGFSTRTWTPARAAAIVGAAWQGWGVQTQSACTRARSTISATSVKALTPYRSAKAPRRSEGRLQTATNSDSGRARSAAACRWATLPAPTRAVLSFSMEISRLRSHPRRSGLQEHLHQPLFPGVQAAEPFRSLLKGRGRTDEFGHVDPAARDQLEAGWVFARRGAGADKRHLPGHDGLQREVGPRLGIAHEGHAAALAHESHGGRDRRRQAHDVKGRIDAAFVAEAANRGGQAGRVGPRSGRGAQPEGELQAVAIQVERNHPAATAPLEARDARRPDPPRPRRPDHPRAHPPPRRARLERRPLDGVRGHRY